jgi:3D-(3,5/4)-trihydroxycyclohexane-1,2-dione acylhydrolase (decyclizing)
MVRCTVGQAIVRYLQAQHSDYDGQRRRLVPAIFGIFGHGNVAGLGQGLDECGDQLTYLQGHNEQSMVHAAAAFAKATQRAATLACTASIGPGSTNMVTGAAAATINRLPVLLFPSDYYAARAQGPVLQQLEHPQEADVSVNDCFRPVSRFFDRISRPEQLLTALPEAMRILTSPVETGAVTIALPQDVQSHAHDFPEHFFAERTWRISRPPPEPGQVAAAAGVLRESRRPMLIAGGGVRYSRAEQQLVAFAEAAGIPVAETFAGKGSVDQPSWLQLGGLGLQGNTAANAVAREADVVMCVGTRLTDFATASQSLFQDADVRFVSINVNAKDAAKQGALAVTADAREALVALTEWVRANGRITTHEYEATVRRHRRDWEALRSRAILGQDHPGEAMTQGQLIGVLNESARPGDTVIAAAGGPPGDLLKIWDASNDRRCHLEFGYSCMGYELPAGVGVRLAQPDGEVVVFIGDGSYLINPAELVTARQEGLKITVVIAENHGFQSIWGVQMARSGRSFGNEFRERAAGRSRLEDKVGSRLEGDYVPLDLAATARGFGARAWNVRTPDELAAALAEAREETCPCVIVAEVEPHHYLPDSTAWVDIEPAAVSGFTEVRAVREQYELDKAALQRLHY